MTLPERMVEIRALELLQWGDGKTRLRVECSAGTYGSLARDIGAKIGCGVLLAALPTRSSPFHRSGAILLAEMPESWRNHLIPLEDLLPGLPAWTPMSPWRRAFATAMRYGSVTGGGGVGGGGVGGVGGGVGGRSRGQCVVTG